MSTPSPARTREMSDRGEDPHTWPLFGRTTCLGKQCADAVRAATARLDAPLFRGAGMALVALLRLADDWRAEGLNGHVPAIWDERRVLLCDTNAPVTSFPWHEAPPGRMPGYQDALELVCVVMERLEMGPPDVVTAVVILEAFLHQHGGVLHPHSARPLLLACCILARKLTTDADVTTPECCAAVRDCFTGLAPLLMARIEEQLLVLLDWRVPNDPELYRACARNLHEIGGGAAGTGEADLYPVA